MNWRTTLTLLLLAGAIVSGWSVWTHRGESSDNRGSSGRSDYVLHDFELVALDGATGKESFTLRAPRMERDPGDHTMTMETPLFLLPDSEQHYWQVRAKTGWVSEKGNELRLRDDVRVDGPPEGRKVEMRTQRLNVFPNRNVATSPVAVTITQPGSILRGRGLVTNLATRHYEIKSQVRIRHVPPR
ncbi:LPS export ABC transporter periplasmic protein LptC [Luteimonas sp. 50]|uniref:LPS export ABC transporter periplasmic protein LptC n=1 Tax=Cognatiluteimonas sedimenti TaxID=2927791 RepID=A0ABT0A4B7_9GAMM|nr:LPS export ABC transporter periplasmic protein LptC [Lysobacter sedimenti]MCJ0825826.1 LPS export ABC transporter periplasmic protein LptC [Lysobacter sedimenti]